MAKRLAILLLLLLCIAFTAAASEAPAEADGSWLADLEQHRTDREERLRDPNGWFTLAGLFWLEPGANAFGSDPDNPIVLEADGIGPVAGELLLDGETVTVRASPEARLLIDDAPVTEQVLRPDAAEGGPDVLALGRLSFYVVQRGDRFGVRVKDPQHPALAAFDGLDYFPADPAYRLDAAFVPYDDRASSTRSSSAVGNRPKTDPQNREAPVCRSPPKPQQACRFGRACLPR